MTSHIQTYLGSSCYQFHSDKVTFANPNMLNNAHQKKNNLMNHWRWWPPDELYLFSTKRFQISFSAPWFSVFSNLSKLRSSSFFANFWYQILTSSKLLWKVFQVFFVAPMPTWILHMIKNTFRSSSRTPWKYSGIEGKRRLEVAKRLIGFGKNILGFTGAVYYLISVGWRSVSVMCTDVKKYTWEIRGDTNHKSGQNVTHVIRTASASTASRCGLLYPPLG